MFQDCRGLVLTTVSAQAAAAFDHAIDGYLGYRADMAARMQALLAADPDFGLAHCLKGYLFLMGFRVDALGAARAALADGRRCAGTGREKAHLAALAHWADGDPLRDGLRREQERRGYANQDRSEQLSIHTGSSY